MCSLEYCNNPVRSTLATLCEGHYYQQRRGKPFAPLRLRRTGDAPCLVDGCTKLRSSGKYCAMHRARIDRHGSPDVVIAVPDRVVYRRDTNATWSETPTYSGVHQRLRRYRGNATQHLCACGGPAAQWSYVGPRKPGERLPYSDDLDLYAARCVPCHKAADLASLQPSPLFGGAHV